MVAFGCMIQCVRLVAGVLRGLGVHNDLSESVVFFPGSRVC